MRILLLMILIFGINSCSAQSDSEKKLIGMWILVAEKDSFDPDIETIPIGDSESKSSLNSELKTTLTFNKDKTVFINQMGNKYNSSYNLTDSILTLGNRKYILLEIDENKLIYKEKDGLFDKHFEFSKTN